MMNKIQQTESNRLHKSNTRLIRESFHCYLTTVYISWMEDHVNDGFVDMLSYSAFCVWICDVSITMSAELMSTASSKMLTYLPYLPWLIFSGKIYDIVYTKNDAKFYNLSLLVTYSFYHTGLGFWIVLEDNVFQFISPPSSGFYWPSLVCMGIHPHSCTCWLTI